jgi:hypothetical protein
VKRRQLAGDVHALVAPGLERRGFLAAFTERTGGHSEDPFRSLNLGFRTGDDPGRVRANRERVVEALGVRPFAVARQRHGTDVARLGAADAAAGFEDPAAVLGHADILATTEARLPVAVLVADCLPVVLGSEAEGLLVTVHAGWRGLAAGILDRAAGLFGGPGQAAAAIGPAIGPCHYEVGQDVAEAVGHGSPAGAAIERRDGRIALDLVGTATRVLELAGIGEVEVAGVCTACHPERFFSRRAEGLTGRQAVVAMRQ